MNKLESKAGQRGFTIIELMIATSVLSTMLLLVTVIMISIGTLYYKGISQSRVQEALRTITDDVSQNLELDNGDPISTYNPSNPSTGDPSQTAEAYCVGTTRYTYIIGKQLGKDIAHVLWRDTVAPGTCNTTGVDLTAVSPSSGGTELMPTSSRLTQFCIGTANNSACTPNTTSPYILIVGIAYGDHDLLCDNGTADDCSSSNDSMHIWNPNKPIGQVLCKGNTGQQFCATANLTTTVAQRLSP